MRKGATLIEVIFTLVIAGLLIVGTSEMLKNISTSAQKAKELSNLSLDTQSVINQISTLLYHRVPNSVIGYDGSSSFEPIVSMTNNNKILEWFGVLHEGTMQNVLSNFIDLQASNFTTKTLVSPNSNFSALATILGQKFPSKTIGDTALFFAGSFDEGAGNTLNFGWHGSLATNVHKVDPSSSGTSINLLDPQPDFIYEKYYIADTAYAVARGKDISSTASCISDLDIPNSQMDDALILFYNYRPWNGETFCADGGSGGVKAGNATLLSLNIKGLRAKYENFTIRISVDAQKSVRGLSNGVHVAKQKVIF